MGEHETLTAASDHARHNLREREINARQIAVERFQVKAVASLIDVGNPKPLACRVTPQETVIEKTAGGAASVKLESIR